MCGKKDCLIYGNMVAQGQSRISSFTERIRKLLLRIRRNCFRKNVGEAKHNNFEWSSYEEIVHYEEIPIGNDDHSSDASTYDSGITVGKQLASSTSPTNIVVTEAIIENQKPSFLSSTINSCYNNELAQIHRAEKVDDICRSSTESTSKNIEYCEIYSSVQRQNKKFNSDWYESLNKIEIEGSNGEQNLFQIGPDDGFFDAKEDIPDNKRDNLAAEPTSDNLFYTLKKMRDIECVKLNQSSNVLRAIVEKPECDWREQILAETILLENELRYQLIAEKIRELNYMEDNNQTKGHTADIILTNFQFEQREISPRKLGYTDFFVLVISCDTQLFVTKAVSQLDGKILFTERICLKNVDDKFSAKIEVYSMKLKTERSFVDSLLRKKSKSLCPMFRIYYEDVHTYELHESKILKPSFHLCGSFVINKNDLRRKTFTFSQMMANSPLSMELTATIMTENINLKTNVSGFLTLARPDKDNNVVYWDRKWCTLEGSKFSVYNYPQDKSLDKPPIASVNLEYCLEKLSLNRCASKRKSFVLKTGRPRTLDDSNKINLKHKNNFVLDKYFLAADNTDDFEKWTIALDSALEFLGDWDKLVFGDDYYMIA